MINFFKSIGNFIKGIFTGANSIVNLFNLVVSNILWVVLSIAIAIAIILIIWFIFKSPPHWILCILITFFCVCSCLTICYIVQQKRIDAETHIPTNKEQSENLDISVKENWTNTNGGFTINQISKTQKDSDAPTLDDEIFSLHIQDYGSYVCFYYLDDSTLYQNAVFLKTEKGLVYDGMLMTTCHYDDTIANIWWSIATIWGSMTNRVYLLDSLKWNVNKNQVPYYYDYNLATVSSGDSCQFCTSGLDTWAWNHNNTQQARARIMSQLSSGDGIIANNINSYFTKFNNIELIGTKENATKSINTFYNYLWEQMQGIGSSGTKNINITDLTCYPIPTELQSNYPIPDSKKADYDNANYYGVYKVNTFVTLSLEQGNKTISKNKNADKYVEENKDSGRFDSSTITNKSAEYTNVDISLNLIDGDITNVDLSINPVTIKFTCNGLDLEKTIIYNTKNKLNSLNNILLVSKYKWDYEISSNALIFEQNKGSFEPVSINGTLELNYSYYDNHIIAEIGLFPIQTIDESLIDLAKNPVKIILTNGTATHQFIFNDNSLLHKSIGQLVALGKYNYTILSDQLIFASVSGEIEITTTQTSFLFNYAQTVDVGNLIFSINVTVSNGSGIHLNAPSSVVDIIRENLSATNKTYLVKLYFFDKDGNIVEIKTHTHGGVGGCTDNWNIQNLINGNEYDCQIRFVDSVDDNLTYISDNYHFTYDNTKSYTFNYTAKVK